MYRAFKISVCALLTIDFVIIVKDIVHVLH